MQGDRRRFNAPPGSTPLNFSVKATQKSSSRIDGRGVQEIRPLFIQLGLIPEAAGSAYIETGNMKVICSVYGPKPVPASTPFSEKAKLNVDVKFTPFASGVRRFTPGKDTESASLSASLHQSILPSLILDQLPKSAIEIYLVILESDGWNEDISVGVTAASLALGCAGIPMRGITTGIFSAYSPEHSSPLLDPSRADLTAGQLQGFQSDKLIPIRGMSIACIPALGTLTNINSYGRLSTEEYQNILQQNVKACQDIHRVAQDALREYHAQKAV